MNILVYYPAASTGGSITILENFYKEVSQYTDKSIHWYFVISSDILQEKGNIHIVCLPWVKKSYLHRIYCDSYYIPKLIKKLNINIVYSMQNMPIRHTQAKQIVYLHQSLQYCKKKFSFFKKSERALAFRQKIILQINKHNLKKSDLIIVQTKWIKDETVKWLNFPKEKVKLVSPKVDISNFGNMKYEYVNNCFFYPASNDIYKNHKVILEACKKLIDDGITNFEIVFTLEKKQLILDEYKKCKNNIKFVGYLKKDKVYDYYKQSILLFPSYLETFGLPLEEAKSVGSIIFASNMPFSHEILDSYENSYFFDAFDSIELYELMKKAITNEITYKSNNKDFAQKNKMKVIDYILGE